MIDEWAAIGPQKGSSQGKKGKEGKKKDGRRKKKESETGREVRKNKRV